MTEFRTFSTPYGDIDLYYRPGTSDEAVIKEVVDQHCYRHTKSKFDVEPGEEWLDLGANIGAFVVYALMRGASDVHAWEPEPSCYELLEYSFRHFLAGPVTLENSAVTHHPASKLEFFKGNKATDHYRATTIKTKKKHPSGTLPNVYAPKAFKMKRYHGCKMDIEGSEFGLIEEGMLPKCNKLVMEYHLSRDKEMSNFRSRRMILQETFDNVYHIPSLDQAYPNDQYPGKFDRFIWCWND